MKRGKVEFVLLEFLIWWMMLCVIRGKAHRKTNNYHFNTEGRKIIWLENTHQHMLSSISVALAHKLIPHETMVRRAVLNDKNTLKLVILLFDFMTLPTFISPNICKLPMKLLHTTRS